MSVSKSIMETFKEVNFNIGDGTNVSNDYVTTWESLPDVELIHPIYENISRSIVNQIMTEDAVKFVVDLVTTFDQSVEHMQMERKMRKMKYLLHKKEWPNFLKKPVDPKILGTWKVWPVPNAIKNRKIDLGDVSPADKDHFVTCLNSEASGIQVDFDDGNCPTWSNMLNGLYNIKQIVHNKLKGPPKINKAPVLMLRPRAWNLIERNLMVNGKQVPAPLFDFGLLMYHNAEALRKAGVGPFFYLSKLEGATEAKLWDDIFSYTERKLKFEVGTIKATVLIENIFAAFEMDEILWYLRRHSLGLNAGIWDYTASFIANFGEREEMIFGDRDSCISIDAKFVSSYMRLMIATCHRRGAPATSGMSPQLLLPEISHRQSIIDSVVASKRKEVKLGFDGFLVYDDELVKYLKPIFDDEKIVDNQINKFVAEDLKVSSSDLLNIPKGCDVTITGLKHNVAIGIRFIDSWLKGQGTFLFKTTIEDSATAEISMQQVWQWIRHGSYVRDMKMKVTRKLVHETIKEFMVGMFHQPLYKSNNRQKELLVRAATMFEDLVVRYERPTFVTTFLYDQFAFTSFTFSAKI